MFKGVNHISMDAKGRVAIPSKYRTRLDDACGGRLVATIHLRSKCLVVYPLPVWEDIEKEVQELPTLKPGIARYQRLLLGYAEDVDLDGSGRFLIPASLRNYASLEKQTVLVGQGKRFELWNETLWEQECAACFDETGSADVPEEFFSVPL